MSEQPQANVQNALVDSQRQQSIGEYVSTYIQRLSSGDLGSLPIIIGIVVIAIIFQFQNSNFLTPRNFVNLILQMAGITMMAYGVVFVLLLGEIDLSIGYVSAIGGVAVALLLRDPDGILPPVLHITVFPLMIAAIWAVIRIIQKRRSLSADLDWLVVAFVFVTGATLVPLLLYWRAETQKTKKSVLFGFELAVVLVIGVLITIALFNMGFFPVIATWYTVIPIALLATAAIGLLQGAIITYFQVPSFIVTLSGLLAWNGVVLRMIGGNGTVIIQDDVVKGIAGEFLPAFMNGDTPIQSAPISLFGFNMGQLTLSWGLVTLLAFVAGFAIIQVFAYVTRKAQNLNTRPLPILALQIVGLSLVAFVVAHIADQDRGVPVVGLILLVFLVILTFITNNTQFGRFVFAVGGNPEAARRAGINVTRIRIYVFMLSSALAGMGGIILASRLRSVATNAGGGNILLNAIAAAVIGGTSLFGGRGRISSAVLGALVIASVDNGMGLLNLSSGDKFIITGIVLLVAVVVDSLSLRRQQQSGIA
ncbi:MAG: hypothetical protein WBC91_17360 [Phototrophicaceae bacterium]